LLPLFDPAVDANGFDRMLLSLATHDDGGGFERALMLVWSADLERFEGWLAWHAPQIPLPLEAWLEAAARQASVAIDVDRQRAVRERLFSVDDLPEVARRAWQGAGVACGTAPDDGGPWRAGATLGAVALDGAHRYALLIGEWRDGDPADPARLEAVRRAAGRALSVRAQSGERERLQLRLATASELVRAASGSRNVAEVAQTLAEAAMKMGGTRGALLWRMGEGGEPLLVGASGAPGARERAVRALSPLVRAALGEGRAQRHGAGAPDARVPADLAPALGAARVMPFGEDGRVSGALAVYGRDVGHPSDPVDFGADTLAVMAMVADLAARLFERASADTERRGLERRARELQSRAERAERAARLGEMAARAAHEARNPAAAIAAFARRVHRNLPEGDINREYLEVILRETGRLERALLDPAQLTDPGPGGFALADLNAVVSEVLQRQAEHLVRRRVRLLKRLTPDLPRLLLDSERVRRVLHNIVQHALDEVSAGGRIRIETRRAQGHVVVEVAHDGPRPSGELLEHLFVPFQLARPAAGPVALAVARQIVQEHGGEIRVRSEGEWGTIFSFTLPVHGNEDRRRPGGERRVVRTDRRSRTSAT